MNSYLDIESNDIRFIGICGMSGMGKTTLAKVVFDRIHHKFEACSFLENVREFSEDPNGLKRLQDQLLHDMKLNSEGDLEMGTQNFKNQMNALSIIDNNNKSPFFT